jgi:hypothetical protein
MDEITEIAYAAAFKSLCLFTGTGFSKAVTGGAAPSWQALLENACSKLPDAANVKQNLFPGSGKDPLSLDAAAQVIAFELAKNRSNIYDEIYAQINQLQLAGNLAAITDFLRGRDFDVITTNYDLLFEFLAAGAGRVCHSLAPGVTVPHSHSDVDVYHVHGSIYSPKNMVVTSDDYFKFMNRDSYFSKKLSTILHENTIVMLGYSLGDTNLKSIINEYRVFARNNGEYPNLFFVTREFVDQRIKDYYSHCYGIRVVENTEILTFFQRLNAGIAKADGRVEVVSATVREALRLDGPFDEAYIRDAESFYEIIYAVAAIGAAVNNSKVVSMIGRIIAQKTDLTYQNNAWDQYNHLADWLIYLGEIVEIYDKSIRDVYLKAVLNSMLTMGNDTGKAWAAMAAWQRGWRRVLASNRHLIRQFIESNTTRPEALGVVRSL